MLTANTVERMYDGHLVQHYLLASYAYYVWDKSPMTDDAFDLLCVRLLERYDYIEHPHKHLIDKGMLEAGTGYYIREQDYPSRVVHGIEQYIDRCMSGEQAKQMEPHLKPLGGQQLLF